jgi:O-antigen ligase
VKTARAEKKSVASNAPAKLSAPVENSGKEQIILLGIGLWLGISLIKFGNPVIFNRIVTPPQNFAEFIFTSWPVAWGYVLLGITVLISLPLFRPKWRADYWPILLLGFWLFWQFLSSTRTVSKPLTSATLPHFVSCVVSFALGCWALSRVRLGGFFWTPVFLAFFYTLFSGFDQQNGGLEAMRKVFYEQPNWQTFPPEYLKRMSSNRIFSTFVYPNAFAGAIILLLPAALWQSWNLTACRPRIARGVLVGLFGYLAIACLYWTGSKGGWLIALLMIAVCFLHLEFPRKVKVILITAGLVLGMAAFFIRFSGYFQKGATSVGARFTYWSAAWKTTRGNPVFGSGPGTFSVPYARIKPPEAEMAKLVHNDYLEQFSDSGILGGVSFAGFIVLSIAYLYRTAWVRGWGAFTIWLGLVGWAAQSLIEFGLYIPGTAWMAFLFLGWLWGMKEESGIQSKS